MISTLIKMQPVAVDLSRFSDPNAKMDLSLLLGGKEKEFIDDAEFIEDPNRALVLLKQIDREGPRCQF